MQRQTHCQGKSDLEDGRSEQQKEHGYLLFGNGGEGLQFSELIAHIYAVGAAHICANGGPDMHESYLGRWV